MATGHDIETKVNFEDEDLLRVLYNNAQLE